ncbi:MAG: hypothetical protein RCG15_08470 [Candidatus Rickettsia vulgarisii]
MILLNFTNPNSQFLDITNGTVIGAVNNNGQSNTKIDLSGTHVTVGSIGNGDSLQINMPNSATLTFIWSSRCKCSWRK